MWAWRGNGGVASTKAWLAGAWPRCVLGALPPPTPRARGLSPSPAGFWGKTRRFWGHPLPPQRYLGAHPPNPWHIKLI